MHYFYRVRRNNYIINSLLYSACYYTTKIPSVRVFVVNVHFFVVTGFFIMKKRMPKCRHSLTIKPTHFLSHISYTLHKTYTHCVRIEHILRIFQVLFLRFSYLSHDPLLFSLFQIDHLSFLYFHQKNFRP